jgi:hypothetical protein
MHLGLNMLLEHDLVGPSPTRVALNGEQHSRQIGSVLEDLRAALSTREPLNQQSYGEKEGSVSINRETLSITLSWPRRSTGRCLQSGREPDLEGVKEFRSRCRLAQNIQIVSGRLPVSIGRHYHTSNRQASRRLPRWILSN